MDEDQKVQRKKQAPLQKEEQVVKDIKKQQ
jgi:hypothetical protein